MNKWLASILMLAACAAGNAQQEEVRVNPRLGTENADGTESVSLAEYPFLNIKANRLTLNGADWTELRDAFQSADSTVVRVLHIGDSHIQAEGATSRIRTRLQKRYGSAGRGLIAPFRLAGTNAPRDYALRSSAQFTASRLLKHPWEAPMGFSGVSIQPNTERFDLTVNCGEAFDCLRIYSIGGEPVVESMEPDVLAAFFSPGEGVTDILLTRPETEVTFQLKTKSAITAVELMSGLKGVEYSAIGNNGAAFESYNAVPDFAASTSRLNPDLIIISLGTNEAFGRCTDAQFTEQMDKLISDIRRHNPQAALLLTTPQECYRRSYTGRKGRRRRRAAGYSVNAKVAHLRELILTYAAEHKIAVYDWYDVAGGGGSARHWLDNHLMNTDRIHLTWSGYHLQGDLMADAIIHSITNPINISDDGTVANH